jgi:guanine deaminase
MKAREEFMRHAIGLARAGMRRGDGGPFGAVVVRNGEIVGEGWNRVLVDHDPTAHGEITAIRNACARRATHALEDCEIYTTGEPCPMCLGAIQWARIRAVFFGFRVEDSAAIGFDDREFYKEMGLPQEERSIPSTEICRNEALGLIAEYARLPGRIAY